MFGAPARLPKDTALVLRAALAALLLIAAAGGARAAEPIVFYGDDSYPPFESLEDGRAVGINVDLMTAVARVLGRPAEIRLGDWSEAQALAGEEGGVVLGLFGRTPERERRFDFSQPTLATDFAFFVRADGPHARGVVPAPGLRIGVPRGGLAREHVEGLRPRVEVVIVDSAIDGTRKLLRGEIDVLAANAWSERYLLHDLNIGGITQLPPFAQRAGNMAVREGDAALLADIDRALTELKRSGEFDRIIDRWSPSRLYIYTRAELARAAAAGGALLLTVLGLAGAIVALRRKRRQLAEEIARRARTENELRAAHARAEAAVLSKSRFLAAASHDLRQPVQSLFLFFELLKRHVAAGGDEVLGNFGRSLQALGDLLDALLDVSRLDSGIVEPRVEAFEIGELVAEIASGYAVRAQAKGLGLTTSPCPAVVRSDKILLARMIRNLVENALRYTERGGVAIACHPAGDRVRIEVRDTGIGIPAEHAELIWEEFHQVDNQERDRSLGLGLGLAIVRRLSRLLDHPVGARSRPGEGSVFSIEVPVGSLPQAAAASPAGALGAQAP